MEHDKLTTSQFNFIGTILSLFSHEMNNHLAIVKNSVGLIGDFIRMGKTTRRDLHDMLKTIRSIEDQIDESSYFCDSLSGFGHGMEEPISDFSVHRSMEEVIVLLRRLASQRKVQFEKNFTANIPLIHNNPLKIQFLIFCFIERNLRRLDKNSKIIIKTTYSNNSIGITIIPKGNFVKDEEGLCKDEVYQELITQLGGSISQETTDGAITILFPVSLPSGSDRG